ncbi:MAG: peptide deformylase [bacterium]
MAIREIRMYGDPILRKPAERVGKVDAEIERIIDDMLETMYMDDGVGLAAPQIGVSKRIIVVDATYKSGESQALVIVNPEIVEAEGEMVNEEGCLSFPDIRGNVRRSRRVVVRGLDREGREMEVEAQENLLAIALQHEIDHIDGVLFIDKMVPSDRKLNASKLQRLKKETRRRSKAERKRVVRGKHKEALAAV